MRYPSFYPSDPEKHAEQVALALAQLARRAEKERKARQRQLDTPGGRLWRTIYTRFHEIEAPDMVPVHTATCPNCGWEGCTDCANGIAPGGAMGGL
jgi:hypothetical protein